MENRFVSVILIALLALFHVQLWSGRGSIPNVHAMQKRLNMQMKKNTQAQLNNDQLLAEVKDLQEGLDIVEEKARRELGMVKPNEIFVQITP